ncbi:MAG: hypothetical protein KAS32_11685 [Candidatus Peribacteraceae bacterium]|nr:hypothetical protein [Candidatus Peribacteraceae bacterium]
MSKLMILSVAVFLSLVLSMPVQSLEIVSFMEVDGDTFWPFDSVDLGMVIINDESRSVVLFVEQYIVYPKTPPMPLLEEMTIAGNGDEMISDLSFEVSEYSEAGEYDHVVRVYEDDEMVLEKTSTFYIYGTTGKLEGFTSTICADHGCTDVRPVFELGETAYIFVECPNIPQVSGYVDYPDGSSEHLVFSGDVAKLKPVLGGVYTANIILSKEGFTDEVIEKEITFEESLAPPSYFFCSDVEDDMCDIHCKEGEDPDCIRMRGEFNFLLIVSAIIVIVMLVIGTLLFKMRN